MDKSIKILVIIVLSMTAIILGAIIFGFVSSYLAIQDSNVEFTTEKTGIAIQIQSVTINDIYVQNVGDGDVTFGNRCVYVDGVSAMISSGTGTLTMGETTDLKLTNAISSGSHTVKVTTVDGTFSQITKVFS